MNKLLKLLILCTILPAGVALADTYTVKSGDSLWRIAERTKSPEISTHRMIAAIHAANTGVLGEDIGNLRPGMVLEIPAAEKAAYADSSEATRLLAGDSHISAATATKAQALIHKIDNIQQQINQTMKDIEATQTAFEASSIQ